MNSATHLKMAILQRALQRRGFYIRQSRAGVKYIIPFSRYASIVRPGKPTSDGRVYRQTARGYFVRDGVDDGAGLAA
jgi:hypothetical protein